jgi:hypothetical protein
VATTTKRTARGAMSKRLPVVRDLDGFNIVLTPAASSVLTDAKEVLVRFRDAFPEPDYKVPEEVVLWRGTGDDRIVALTNRYVDTVYVERFGAMGGDPRREQAFRTVALGIGARPDRPSGKEDVRRVRGIWRGLLPREHS